MEPNENPKTTRDNGGIEHNPDPEPPLPGYERTTNILGRPIVDVYKPTLAEEPRSYYNYRILAGPTPQNPANNQDARIFPPTRHQLPNGLTFTTNPDPMVENFYQNLIAAGDSGRLKGQPNHLDPSSTYLVLTNLFGTTEGAPSPRIMAHSAVYSLQNLLKGEETTTNCWCITIHPIGENNLGDYEQGSEEYYQKILEKHKINVHRLGLVDTDISLSDDELRELFHPSVCDDLAKPVQGWVEKTKTKWEYLWHVNTIFVDADPAHANLAEKAHQEASTQAYLQPLLKTETSAAEKAAKATEITISTPAENQKLAPEFLLLITHIKILTLWADYVLKTFKKLAARQRYMEVTKNTDYRLAKPLFRWV